MTQNSLLRHPPLTLTKSHVAQEIMVTNFFGIQEVATHFDVYHTPLEKEVLKEVPWSVEVLESHKDDFLLVAGYPIAIRSIFNLYPTLFYETQLTGWGQREPCVNQDHVGTRWYLIRKSPAEATLGECGWLRQRGLLSPNEEPVKACEMVYGIIGHFLATGERLFEKTWARCADLLEGGCCGDHAMVGCFEFGGPGCGFQDKRGGLHVTFSGVEGSLYKLGLASARIPGR